MGGTEPPKGSFFWGGWVAFGGANGKRPSAARADHIRRSRAFGGVFLGGDPLCGGASPAGICGLRTQGTKTGGGPQRDVGGALPPRGDPAPRRNDELAVGTTARGGPRRAVGGELPPRGNPAPRRNDEVSGRVVFWGGIAGGPPPPRGALRRAKRLDQQRGKSVDELCPQPKTLFPTRFGYRIGLWTGWNTD